ncbi:transposable element Tcb1 transposase [Trichonephila clavipes]|nr:transposable element Tcb1 transposase [Trichonephila clavipes]
MPHRRIRAHYEQPSEFERCRIIGLKERGFRQIGESLVMGRSAAAIRRCWQEWVNSGRFQRHDGSGRPRTTADQEDRLIVKSAVTALDSSLSTIIRATMFSDEFLFHLGPEDHRRRVLRRPGQHADHAFTIARPTSPQQGVMIWGAISFEAGPLWSLLEAHLQHSGRRLRLPGNVDELARQLEQIWQEIPQETIRVLYRSMSRRVAACIHARDLEEEYASYREPPDGADSTRHNDKSVREGYIRNGGKEVNLFTSALKAFQYNDCIVMAQRKDLDDFYVVELLDGWNMDVPSWKYPRNLESPRVSSPGFGNDSKRMVINRRSIASDLSRQLSSATGTTVSRQIEYRRLGHIGLYARRPVRCVPLTATHCRLRLTWSREHALWTPPQWSCVMFSDEFRFSLQSDSRRTLIWRAPGTRYHQENTIERHRYGGAGWLVWGGIILGSRTDLHFQSVTITSHIYRDVIL